MVNAYYHLIWHDEQRRVWAHRFGFANIPDARAAHRESQLWMWVRAGMHDPIVSELAVQDGRTTTIVADGARRRYESKPDETPTTPFG